jgi:hypothetical protein
MGFKYFVRSPLAFCIDLFTLHANSVLLLYFPFMFRIPSSVLTTNTFIALSFVRCVYLGQNNVVASNVMRSEQCLIFLFHGLCNCFMCTINTWDC